MRILVTGTRGQVASALRELSQHHEMMFIGRPELDLNNLETIERTIDRSAPELIISAAAYTAVDTAEDDHTAAWAANAAAPGSIGRSADALGIPVIHLSTDYVFSGVSNNPYKEDDTPSPIGVYGTTKLAGERALSSSSRQWTILRTAWVYSPFGSNFVKTMLRLARDRDRISVVGDQIGNPTSAFDIAEVLLKIADSYAQRPDTVKAGVYHFAGSESMSWAEFARRIFARSRDLGGPSCFVEEIATSEFPTRAKRPHNSRLSSAKLMKEFDIEPRDFYSSLDLVLRRLI